MKKLLLTTSIVLLVSFLAIAGTKAEDLQKFLSGIVDVQINQLSGAEPLVQVAQILNDKASKNVSLTKTNIKDAIQEASNYKYAIVIVGKHTIVKITDSSDKVSSGAWGIAMPKGAALIQKSGTFIEQTNYLNNLIGIPDHQERKLYLIN